MCVEYKGISETQEREIFQVRALRSTVHTFVDLMQRVQMGMALTPSEKLAVIDTHRSRFIRSLIDKYLTESGVLSGPPLDWDRSRGGDFRTFALAVWVTEHFLDEPATCRQLPGASQLSRWLSAVITVPSSVETTVTRALDDFEEIVRTPAHKHVFRLPAKMAPIEVAMFTVLIAAHRGKPHEEIVSLMQALRADVRMHHNDVRSNAAVAHTILDFIYDSRRGPAAGALRKRKQQAQPEQDDAHPKYVPGSSKRPKTASANRSVGSSSKSKIQIVESESEDEEIAAPRPRPTGKKRKSAPKVVHDTLARPRDTGESLGLTSSVPMHQPRQAHTGLPSLPTMETAMPVIGGIFSMEAMMSAQGFDRGMERSHYGGYGGMFSASHSQGASAPRERDPRDFRRR